MDTEYATVAYVNFLFGLFCAYWARTTDRDPWGWFFFAFFLAPIAQIVLVARENNENQEDTAKE
jgi:hypothetical protein